MHYSAWSTKTTLTNMQKFSVQKIQTELLKKKLCYLDLRNASVKPEGSSVNYDAAQETFTARYTHETLALAFSITEEAIEDNLYDRLASRYTKALARSMANSKQVKAANVLNRAFNSSYTGGDGLELCSTSTRNCCWY